MDSEKRLDVKIIWSESYLKAIENSVGSNMFRNLFAYVDGKKTDIRKDGQLSCSAFVSSILYLHKLCYDIHATVGGLIKDMELFGWEKINKPRPGAVLLWEPLPPKNRKDKMYLRHDHVGFYIGNGEAISNRPEKRQPSLHHWTFGVHPVKSGKAGARPVKSSPKEFNQGKQFDGVKNGRPVRKIKQIFWNTRLNK